ncbi:type VII secretion protein EccB [Saccharomonospora sp. NPDC006951]
MPSTPTTKSQVQAYRFVLRRMQSALVRKDAVMLHDPMRTHSRATIVGAVLSALAMLGFVVFGLFKPAPKAPDSGIVIGEQSGAIYVVSGNPKKLVPTFNLASARLMLMAQQQGDSEAGGQQPVSAVGNVVEPTVVPDEQLKDIPRGRLQGIPNGPELLPAEDQLVSSDWALCDETKLDMSLPSDVRSEQAQTETTVFAGLGDLGEELAQSEALLVAGDNGKTFLIYRQGTDTGDGHTNAVRAEVDLTNSAVRNALNLDLRQTREISRGLLNAIPAVGEVKAPIIQGAETPPQGFDVDGLTVGSVFSTQRTDSVDYYVVTRSGVQLVPQAVAELIRYQNTTTEDGQIPSVSPDMLQNVPAVDRNSEDFLDVDYYPEVVPRVLPPEQRPSACVGWSVDGEGANRDARTSVYVLPEAPGPKNDQGEPQVVRIGSPSPDGWKVDNFYMQPGYAAAVRAATTKETFDRGSIQLISDRGLRYGIPDAATAEGLGLGAKLLKPAPESIIKLLPVGASLNTQDVQRTFDAVPVDPSAGSLVADEQASAEGN